MILYGYKCIELYIDVHSTKYNIEIWTFNGVGSNVADFSFVTSEVSLSQLANSSCSAVYEGSGAQPLQVSKQWADFESTEKSRNSYLH